VDTEHHDLRPAPGACVSGARGVRPRPALRLRSLGTGVGQLRRRRHHGCCWCRRVGRRWVLTHGQGARPREGLYVRRVGTVAFFYVPPWYRRLIPYIPASYRSAVSAAGGRGGGGACLFSSFTYTSTGPSRASLISDTCSLSTSNQSEVSFAVTMCRLVPLAPRKGRTCIE
jgi:hypothetical protein